MTNTHSLTTATHKAVCPANPHKNEADYPFTGCFWDCETESVYPLIILQKCRYCGETRTVKGGVNHTPHVSPTFAARVRAEMGLGE